MMDEESAWAASRARESVLFLFPSFCTRGRGVGGEGLDVLCKRMITLQGPVPLTPAISPGVTVGGEGRKAGRPYFRRLCISTRGKRRHI